MEFSALRNGGFDHLCVYPPSASFDCIVFNVVCAYAYSHIGPKLVCKCSRPILFSFAVTAAVLVITALVSFSCSKIAVNWWTVFGLHQSLSWARLSGTATILFTRVGLGFTVHISDISHYCQWCVVAKLKWQRLPQQQLAVSTGSRQCNIYDGCHGVGFDN